jgi:nucleotide-binding universal stress UspA family protein
MMYRNIMLTVDGSATSDAALDAAAKLVREGARLQAIPVVDNPALTFPPPYGVSYDVGAMRDAMIENGENTLRLALERLHTQGVDNAETHLVDLTSTISSNIASAILTEAKRFPADIIVIGSHGRRGLKRVVLGSVAEEVMRSSNIPILLVRAPDAT